MRLLLALLFAFALISGAVAAGVILELRRRGRASPPSERGARLASDAVAKGEDRIHLSSHGPLLTVEWTEGDSTYLARVPRAFADVRLEDGALIFEYVPGLPSAERRVHMPGHLGRALQQHIRDRLELPRHVEVLEADEPMLRRDPAAFSERVVCLEASWSIGFESSTVAGLWLTPPDGRYDGSTRLVRILGLVLYSGASRGHGHLGAWEGEIVPFEIAESTRNAASRASG